MKKTFLILILIVVGSLFCKAQNDRIYREIATNEYMENEILSINEINLT